jgi:hypothetical protein
MSNYNPMAGANIAIINDLKRFLLTISSDAALKALYCFSPDKSFVRARKLSFSCTALLVVYLLKRSISIELVDFFESYSLSLLCSKQAFCKRRIQIKPLFFQAWNSVLTASFYKHYGTRVKRWKGFIVWAIDGSTLSLPPTAELQKSYGCAPKAYNVTARISLVFDVLNRLVIHSNMGHYTCSEKELARCALEALSVKDKLLLFDRGYSGYWLTSLLMEKQAKFIIRAKKNENKEVTRFLDSAQTDTEIAFYPGAKSLKKLQATGRSAEKHQFVFIRLIKVPLDNGETELLMTNLYDTKKYPRACFRDAYFMRWGVETCYGELKEHFQWAQFSGIRQICIEQDVAAALFAYNLKSLVEKQAQKDKQPTTCKKTKHHYQLNRNIAVALLKRKIIALFQTQNCRTVLEELEKLFAIHKEPVRKGRKFARTEKPKPPGKFYTYTNYRRAI